MYIYCLLFPDYEALDLMGPVEFLHFLPDVQLHYTSLTGGNITAHQQFSVATVPLSALPADSLLLLPGGMGTRALVHDAAFLAALARACAQSAWVLSVCTGVALLAAAGVLDGLPATSNKRAFAWVRSVNPRVDWRGVARWVRAGKYYTASGISAGMDMTLGFIADQYGVDTATAIANRCEYHWQGNPAQDEFAALYR